MKGRSRGSYGVLIVAALLIVGCGHRDPSTAEDRRARGEKLLDDMSNRLSSAKSIGVTTTEEIARVDRNGRTRTDHLTRSTLLRRPDRMYFKVTGDRNLEGFYDGGQLTLVAHKERVFGSFRTPPTIDETVEVASERYGLALPVGDILTSSPQRALLSSQTAGGWAGRDTIAGTSCARLEWQHPNVDWIIWIPEQGEPLPRKLRIVYKARPGRPDATVGFTNWDLKAVVSEETFAPRVPPDYEGVAVIQRAAAVLTPVEPKPSPTTGQR